MQKKPELAVRDQQRFYEEVYERSMDLAGIPRDDDFLYGQVVGEIRRSLGPGASVLDLGCNTGNLSLYMARRGGTVTGIDIARNAVDVAGRSAVHHRIEHAKFLSMDFLVEWSEPQAFDFILCSHVVEHVVDDRAFVAKLAWALKPGGSLVILSPCSKSSLYRLNMLFKGRYEHDESVGHLRRYTKESLSALCAGATLDVYRAVYLDGILRDWFILCKGLQWSHRILSRRYVRSAFNAVDFVLAQFLFPGAVCVHARKPRA
jgi:2-polyprenyl-3-methyl-5-hydroxy-6-metoxy-1,4-benzoquinol methylase